MSCHILESRVNQDRDSPHYSSFCLLYFTQYVTITILSFSLPHTPLSYHPINSVTSLYSISLCSYIMEGCIQNFGSSGMLQSVCCCYWYVSICVAVYKKTNGLFQWQLDSSLNIYWTVSVVSQWSFPTWVFLQMALCAINISTGYQQAFHCEVPSHNQHFMMVQYSQNIRAHIPYHVVAYLA